MYKSKFLLLVILVFLIACEEKSPQLYPADGDSITLSQLQGKVLLINYWAEWCKPCREEIPELNAFSRENPDKVMVYAVNFDGISGAALREQADNIGIEFPLLERDPRDLFGVSPSGVLPETLVIDQHGEFRQVLLGPQTTEKLEMLLSSFNEEVHYSD